MKSQLAACLEVPGCKGLGLIKQPVMRHSRKLRPGRYSCAFLKCVCVLLIAHLDIKEESQGEVIGIRKTKVLRESALGFPRGRGFDPLQMGNEETNESAVTCVGN